MSNIFPFHNIRWPLKEDTVETSDEAELIHNTIELISHSCYNIWYKLKAGYRARWITEMILKSFYVRSLPHKYLGIFFASIFILVGALSIIKCKYF